MRVYGDVRDANEMRMILKGKYNESRIDYTDRKFTRCVEEGWLLLPDMQRTADRAKVSTEVDGYASTKGCTGEIHRAVWEEKGCRLPIGVIQRREISGLTSRAHNKYRNPHSMREKGQRKRKNRHNMPEQWTKQPRA